MDGFLGEWLNLLLRWGHMIAGIAWIGTSFYFVALDFSLKKPAGLPAGVGGEAWEVHGGGFYHVQKYLSAPARLPSHLIWFKWEAYLTWVTGFLLLVVQYYFQASAYLIDPAVMALAPWQAIAISAVSIVAGWAVYDALCRSPLGRNTTALAASVFALVLGSAFLFTHVFSGRGAFIQTGVVVGTIMAANVFMVIIPNQRKITAALIRGETPDPRLGAIGKQRSLHNTYLTLPVLLLMISNHFAMLTDAPNAWLLLGLVFVGGAALRHFLVRHEVGDPLGKIAWTLPVIVAALGLAWYLSSAPLLSLDWANLLIRWGHMIAGIAWIGTSFYFVALDFSLRKHGALPKGVAGEAWEVHGGGFYHVRKYLSAPETLPKDLIWFKWEAYLTWVTGFLLLVVLYYFQAETYLIDPSVMPLTRWQAIGISVGSLAAGWLLYSALCRSPLGRNAGLLGTARLRAHPRGGLVLRACLLGAWRLHPCRRADRHHHGGQRLHGDHSQPAPDHCRAAQGRDAGPAAWRHRQAALAAQYLSHAAGAADDDQQPLSDDHRSCPGLDSGGTRGSGRRPAATLPGAHRGGRPAGGDRLDLAADRPCAGGRSLS